MNETIQVQCLNIRLCLMQQLEMLKYMRKFPLDDQSAILKKVNKENRLYTFFIDTIRKTTAFWFCLTYR